MSKERWVVSELEKRYGVETTRRWLANLANLQLIGDSMADDIDRLADLLDVLLTNPQDGDILQYEAASQRWKNKIVSGGSGNPVVTQATTILTPEMIRAANSTFIELAPAPGIGKAYIDATSVFFLGDDFAPYGGTFQAALSIGGDILNGPSILLLTDVAVLTNTLLYGAPGIVTNIWLGSLITHQLGGSEAYPASALDNSPYQMAAFFGVPTDGAGDITVVSAMTTITLP